MPCDPATAMAAPVPSTFPKGTAHELLQTILDPLRQISRTRDALSACCPGLGRTHRLGPCAGAQLAADGVRLADPLRRLRWSTGLAVCHRLDRALGGAGRQFGQAQAVAPATADYQPTDPQIAFHLARFIEQVRAIPADAIVVRQNWLRAYDFTTDRGRSRSTTMHGPILSRAPEAPEMSSGDRIAQMSQFDTAASDRNSSWRLRPCPAWRRWRHYVRPARDRFNSMALTRRNCGCTDHATDSDHQSR